MTENDFENVLENDFCINRKALKKWRWFNKKLDYVEFYNLDDDVRFICWCSLSYGGLIKVRDSSSLDIGKGTNNIL